MHPSAIIMGRPRYAGARPGWRCRPVGGCANAGGRRGSARSRRCPEGRARRGSGPRTRTGRRDRPCSPRPAASAAVVGARSAGPSTPSFRGRRMSIAEPVLVRGVADRISAVFGSQVADAEPGLVRVGLGAHHSSRARGRRARVLSCPPALGLRGRWSAGRGVEARPLDRHPDAVLCRLELGVPSARLSRRRSGAVRGFGFFGATAWAAIPAPVPAPWRREPRPPWTGRCPALPAAPGPPPRRAERPRPRGCAGGAGVR